MKLDTYFLSTGSTGGARICDKCKTNPTDKFWCVSCGHEYLNETYPPGHANRRLEAKKSGMAEYPDICVTHGLTLFSSRTGECLPCSGARSLARRTGQPSYLAQCEVHGQTPFSTHSGKCLACFTTAGAPRSGDPDGPRVAARREGARTYLDVCAVHGETPHDTIRGKCLGCFTTLGLRRVQPLDPATIAQARAVLEASGFTPDEIARLIK